MRKGGARTELLVEASPELLDCLGLCRLVFILRPKRSSYSKTRGGELQASLGMRPGDPHGAEIQLSQRSLTSKASRAARALSGSLVQPDPWIPGLLGRTAHHLVKIRLELLAILQLLEQPVQLPTEQQN